VLIELVDDLRCPQQHEETWLVAAADRTASRHIVDGTLGCPVCRAEYPIRDGIVWFDEPPHSERVPRGSAAAEDSELAMRLAAFLDLSDPHGFALLAGSCGRIAPLLQRVVSTHLVLLNPTPSVPAGNGISVLQIRTGIPLAAATCRGVALDDAHADAAYLNAAVAVLRPLGRLVAPTTTPMPAGVTELARDDRLWVAERPSAPPKLVTLQVRGP
jgi:uncharacterized protein YbaR (Trm112 family)